MLLPLGILLLVGLVLLLVVAARRGASGGQIAILVITAIVSIPAALFGILIMGFSGSAEDTQNGAILLAFGMILGGGIAAAYILKSRKHGAG
jgi:hypothetical protein